MGRSKHRWTGASYITSSKDTSFLPYGRPQIGEDDIAAVIAVLRDRWLTTGPTVGRFERALAECVDAAHAVVCSSGTAALHLAMLGLDIGHGDTVIVPSLTFLATANAVRYVGAEVIFADVDPTTGLMGPAELEAALRSSGDARVKAVVLVDFAGQCADLAKLAEIAGRNGLAVIEDACHALGAKYLPDRKEATIGSGQYAHMSVFSFHPVKTVTAGEGGAITTNDEELARRLRRLRSHAISADADGLKDKEAAYARDRTPNPWYYEATELGYNYRLSDIHCALGLSQLAKLDEFVTRRRRLVERYDERLSALQPLVRPLARVPWCMPAWHLYVVRINFSELSFDRAFLMNHLRQRGIGTQVHFIPLHQQPYYRNKYGAQTLPGVETYYAEALSLPLFPAMDGADVDRVADELAGMLEKPRGGTGD